MYVGVLFPYVPNSDSSIEYTESSNTFNNVETNVMGSDGDLGAPSDGSAEGGTRTDEISSYAGDLAGKASFSFESGRDKVKEVFQGEEIT